MSTLEYLTVINARAGRFRGRRDRHAVVPWVADFTENPDVMLRESARFIPGRGDDGYAVGKEKEKGWRDLTKTKWRLTKGDTQLDFSFQHADPKFAHHVSDECLCETTTCVYLARQTPVVELKKRVRSRFVANEYPATVERLYAWSPDEAIPQFYDDPSVFQAPKGGGAREDESSRLGDLRAPSDLGWGDDAFAFVKKHRAILESDRVSHFLPKWIDLTFGVCLFGPKAIAEKNVMVPPADARKPNANARVAVFFHPHPRRGVSVPRNVLPLSSSSERSSSFINEDEVLDDKDPTLTALRGDDPISLTGTPYASPDALAREIAPGPHFAASSKKSVECRSNVKRVAFVRVRL
jgi:WD repeat-containing protein 81